MKRLTIRALVALAVILGLAPQGGEAVAQMPGDLVGSWTLVSNTVDQGNSRREAYGPDPRGLLMLGADGRYALVVMRRELPAFASNNRTTGTPEEYRAVVQGSVAHFGTYSIDQANKVLVFRVEGSTFPNWDGAEQRRPFTLAEDVLTYTVPAGSSGQGSAQAVWRRAR